MFLNGAYLVILSFGPLRLIERGVAITEANALVSLMSWVCIVALPLGGYLATRCRVPNVVMAGGLVASIALGALIPFVPYPFVFFVLLGTTLGLATPVVGSLAAEVLKPSVRGPGFGIYYLWYFGGMPVLLALAGLLRDWTGTATTSLAFATCMLLCCLALAGLFPIRADAKARSAAATDRRRPPCHAHLRQLEKRPNVHDSPRLKPPPSSSPAPRSTDNEIADHRHGLLRRIGHDPVPAIRATARNERDVPAAPPRRRPGTRSAASGRPRRRARGSDIGCARGPENVQPMALGPGPGEPMQHLRPDYRAAHGVRVARNAGVVRHGESSPRVERRLIRLALRPRRTGGAPMRRPPDRQAVRTLRRAARDASRRRPRC